MPRVIKLMSALVATPLLVGVVASPALAGAAAPPGNNGTIKVDGQPLDQGHDNEPHPGCTFRITLFGFDAGTNTADVALDLQPPTGSAPLLHDTFSFTATRDHGGATYDGASPVYDLTQQLAGLSASQQGYHVKISVSVDGGQAKHKVLWVQPCAAAAGPAAVPPIPSTRTAAPARASVNVASSTAAASSGGGGQAVGLPTLSTAALRSDLFRAPAAASPAPATVLGEVLTRPAASTKGVEAARSGSLPFTGFNAVIWSLFGFGLLGTGAVLVRHARRRVEVQ